MTKRITIVDVAARVGVSAKTVSRVANNDLKVSARVRKAVSDAIEELGYRPNLAARSLVSSQSFVILLLTPAFDSTYFQSIHVHLYEACRRLGYHVMAEKIDLSDARLTDSLSALIQDVRPAGMILTSGVTEVAGIETLLTRSGVKWATFGARIEHSRGASVLAQEAAGEAMLADHLWHLGHRQLAVVRTADQAIMTRGRAFEMRLAELGPGATTLAWFDIDTSMPPLEIGRRIALDLLDMPIRPSAIFAFNDDIAAGVISTMLTKGIAVPNEMSVVGFDDSDIAKAIWPSLTTIRQPMADMADRAVQFLVGKSRAPAGNMLCPVQLIIRESTARAPVARR